MVKVKNSATANKLKLSYLSNGERGIGGGTENCKSLKGGETLTFINMLDSFFPADHNKTIVEFILNHRSLHLHYNIFLLLS